MAGGPEVHIRPARAEDAAALRELETRAPLEVGTARLSIDRGEDWFAATRLMDEASVLIAEIDQEPVGLLTGALRRAPIGGVDRKILFMGTARVPVTHGRKGVGTYLVAEMFVRYQTSQADTPLAYAPEGSSAVVPGGALSQLPNRWTASPTVAWLRTADAAGPDAGREADSSDAPQIAALLNAAHAHEDLYAPTSAATLSKRLDRGDPYGWKDVLVGDSAVVGFWPRWAYTSTTVDGSVVSEGQRGIVLDCGCAAGAEGELERLLRAACRRAADAGANALMVFPCARMRSAFDAMGASEPGTFLLFTPSIPEPAAARPHIDPCYL